MDPVTLEALRRQSDIQLTAEGVFELRGAPLENPRVAALFHRGVTVRDDGEVTLEVGEHWCYLPCAGVARFIEALRFGPDGMVARLLGGQERDASAMTVGYAPDDRLYAWLPTERGPALLLRAAHQALLPWIGDDLRLELAGGPGARFVKLDRVPGAAAPSPLQVA